MLVSFTVLSALVQSLVSYLGIILYVAYRTLVTGSMSYDTCIIAINAVTQAAGALQLLAARRVDFQGDGLFAENLLGFLQDDSHQDAIGGEGEMPEKCTLRFENVAFRYPGKSKPSIRKLSLEIKPSGRIALVGVNGAGKTTLVKMLCRLYDPTEGRVLWNGVDAKAYALDSYRRQFSAMFQDYRLFAASAKENVVAGLYQDEDSQRVTVALEESGLPRSCLRCPKGRIPR